MDGSSGIAPVIPKGWFVLFLATFQVAFAISGSAAAQHREKGLSFLERGACDSAVGELLQAVSEGDSSHLVVLKLSQALDCNNRWVEALAATYIDHRIDTAGRIDVLLYRAQLLRKLGLPEEAEKAEKEAGVEIVSTLVAASEEPDASSWNWSPTASGSFGWTYQNDALKLADTLRLIASKIGIRDSVLKYLSQPRAATDDSVRIQGQQIPLLATVGWEIDWSDYYVWVGVPLQAVLKTNLMDWSATFGRMQVQVGGQWSNKWFETNASVSGAKNWSYYPGYAPIRSGDINAALEGKHNFGSSRIVQSNSGNVALDEANLFNGYTGAHSLGFVRDLPWESSLSLGVGYSFFRDRSRNEFETLTDFTVKVIDVQGVKMGMTNQDLGIDFLDSNGVVIPPNAINTSKAMHGMLAAQRVVIRNGFDYPTESKLDWGRWNAGTVFTKNFGKRVTAKLGFDLARTELIHLQRGTYVPETSLYTDHWVSSGGLTTGVGEMILYHDVHTGEEFWDGDLVKGSRYLLGPIFFQRHRVDYTTTATASLTWKVINRLSANLGWTWVRNQSNLEHLVDGSSYNRTVWNASSTVSW